MIQSELLQFTTLQSLVKYDDTIYVVILDNDSFRNLCGIPICTSWCQLNSICLHCIEIHNIHQVLTQLKHTMHFIIILQIHHAREFTQMQYFEDS